jgi:hypothetical protein
MTSSGVSSTQPSAWPLCDFTCSQLFDPTLRVSLMSRRPPWARVASRAALTSGVARTFTPTGVSTQTALPGALGVFGTWVTWTLGALAVFVD